MSFWYSWLFKKIVLIDFRKREEGRERVREKHKFAVPLIYAFYG